MLILLAGTALVAGTALLLATRLADGSITQLLVGAYALAFTEIVAVSFLLSIGSALTRPALLAAVAALFAAAVIMARPVRVPSLEPGVRRLLRSLRDPAVLGVLLAAAGAIAYSLVLGLLTPQSDQDALEYHLLRAALWRQEEGIGYLEGAEDLRVNVFPPNAEIAMAFTMILSGRAQFAPLVQLAAALATALAVFGIARRLGLGHRQALFGAAIFPTLPVVALQSSTALTDIVVASLVATAAFFLLGRTRSNLILAALALAALLGTKLTGVVALPVLLAVGLATHRVRPARALLLPAVGVVAGVYWYGVNLAETGRILGGFEADRVPADAVAAISRIVRLVLATIEAPGAVGLDVALYGIAAAIVIPIAAVRAGGVRRRIARAAVAAAAVAAPLALVPLAPLLVRASQKVFFELGRPDVGYLDPERSTTKASPNFSWYGPVGMLLTAVAFVVVLRAVRRRRLPGVALVLAVAPPAWIVLIGIGIPYYEWNGRFAMGGVALATATWGIVLAVRPLAWATAILAAVTTLLVFVHLHDKPAGIRLLEPQSARSVWSQPDWQIQARIRPEMAGLFRFFERHVPSDARVTVPSHPTFGLSRRYVLPFPFFGSDLSRTLVFARSPADASRAGAGWAVVHLDDLGSCTPGWRGAFRHDSWAVLRRSPETGCP